MADADQALRDVVQTIANEQGYKDCETVIEPFSTGGANFTSSLYRITLSASGQDDLKLFAKVACISEAMRNQMPFDVFDTEMFFYTQLLKRYQELEERHNVPQRHRLATVKHYGSSKDYLKEVLVLEDLSPKGFKIQNRLKSYDWEYASKSVLELAKLHALSIAMFKEYPRELSAISKRLTINMSVEKMKQTFQTMINIGLTLCKKENKGKLQSFLQSLQDQEMDHYYRPRRVSVIAHGDFRPSNLMHRNHEVQLASEQTVHLMLNDPVAHGHTQHPKSCVCVASLGNWNGEIDIFVLDYQTLRVSNPICDLMYFIFSGSDEEFREKHYNQLLEHYYRELCNALKRLGLDPRKVYPKEDFDYELKEMQPFGLIMGIMVTPVMMVEEENAPDMSESSGFEDFFVKPNELAATRVNGIINDFIKLGVLK